MEIHGVIIEISHIQKYIFESNKLKMNIGASYIVDTIFSNIEDIANNLNLSYDTNISNLSNNDITIIFRGGGNIMIVSKNKKDLSSLVKQWHKMLLEKYPGISTNVAYSSVNLNDNIEIKLQELLNMLRDELFKNKNSYHPIIVPIGLGINSICKYTGYPAEIITKIEGNKNERISSVAYSKFIQFNSANNTLKEEYKDILKDKDFILDLNKFRNENESKSNYMSIVHIDGNEIGSKFSKCNSIQETITLSKELKKLIKSAFIHIVKIMIKKTQGKIIPLRPIIMGGDDITFITDYKSGIYLAEKFIEFIKNENKNIDNLEFSAGIAIVKIKYPFSRAYNLADNLCQKAKEKAKIKGGSWINFIVNSKGFTGDFNSFIEKYDVPQGNLLFRPLSLTNNDSLSLQKILQGALILKQWPKNKINKLERVLHSTYDEIKLFINDLNYRDYKLPEFEMETYDKSAFIDQKTPYYDMIELLEFYPMEDL